MNWQDVVRRAKAATAEVDVDQVVRQSLIGPTDLWKIKWGQVAVDLKMTKVVIRRHRSHLKEIVL